MQLKTQPNYQKKIIFFSSAILAILAFLLSIVIVWLLYETAFQEKQADLVEIAQSQARLIEAISQFNAKYSTDDVQGSAFAATLSQIIAAHQRYQGIGKTGEFTLAKREGEQIVFLLSHRHFDLENPKPVSWDSSLAEPMRQALQGRSGTLVGLDYRGETVLAAYEPIAMLNLGIVAKVDLAEIRAPFIRTGLIALGMTVFMIVIGVVAIIWLINPIIIRMIETETYLQAILDHAPLTIYLKDANGRYLLTNKFYQQIFSDDPSGKRISQVYPAKIAAQIRKNDLAVLKSKTSLVLEEQIPHSDGLHTYLSVKFPIVDYHGKISAVCGISTDITERKQTEKALQESEERFRALFENAPDAILLADVETGKIIDANFAASQLIQKPCQEIIGLHQSQLHPPETEPFARQKFIEHSRLAQQDKNIPIEHVIVRSDGDEVPVEIVAHQIHIQGKPVLQGVFRDITERKQIEEALKESENRYRSVITALQEGIVLQNAQGDIIACNPSAEQILGLTKEQMMGITSLDPRWKSIHEDGSPFPGEQHPAMITLRTGQRCSNILMGVHKPNGTLSWIAINSEPLFHEHETMPYAVVASFTDITKRKLAEEALRKSEEHYRRILETTSEGYWLINHNAETIDVNESLCNMLGYRREEMLDKKPQEFVDADNLKIFQSQISIRESTSHRSYEITLKHKNGRDIFTHFSATTIKNETPLLSFALVTDMTASKQAANALRDSEKRFRTLVSHIPGIVYRCANDKDWTMEYISGEVDKISGYPCSDFIHNQVRSYASVIHPDDREKVYQFVQQGVNSKRPYTIEYRIIHKNGHIKWVHEKGRGIFNSKNQLLSLDGVIFDISERKQTEKALLETNKFLEQIMNTTTHAIFVIDLEGQFIRVNQATSIISGYWRQELIGQPFSIVLPPDSLPDIQKQFFKAAVHGRTVSEYETKVVRKDGNQAMIIFSIAPMFQEGKIVSVVGTAEDITKRKQAEIALQQAKEQAESANRAKSEFLATMSHEIRTPMNAVLGFSELLSQLVTNQQQQNYLESIKTAGKTLLTLINDILDLAKIEAGRLEIQYQAVKIYNIFDEIKQIFALKIANKQIDLIVDIDEQLPSALILDEARLRQVLLNLIGNAVKFTDQGYLKLTVQKKDQIDKSHIDLLISVEDTGIGIPAEQQQIIFDAFRQQDGQSTRKYGGTGLGLAITKRLVEMMKGEISVTSTVGKGSVFYITLRQVQISSTSVPVNQSENILPVFFEKALVLVVDDIESNRALIREWLSEAQLEVIEAEDGQMALHQAEKYQPNLIFMDIRMPIMDGYETTQRLKDNISTQKIPIIALTASAMIEEKTQSQKLGFDGYLYKPVQANDLFAELARFLTPKLEKKISNCCRIMRS
jgi:PAS domain S-box-containing protein